MSALVVLHSVPAFADNVASGASGPPAGFYNGGVLPAPTNANFVTTGGFNVNLINERQLAGSGGVTITDGGAKNYATVGLTNTLLYGLTGGTTQQTAVNSILGFGSIATGDLTYYNGTNWIRLPIGSANQYMQVAGGIPAWTTVAAGAPNNSAYLTVGSDATLAAERAWTAGNGITGTDAGANSTYTVAIDTTVVDTLTGANTLTNKTLTSPAFSWNAGGGVTLKGGTNNNVLKWADWGASAGNITLPSVNGTTASSIVLDQGTQTLAGTYTFTNAPKLTSNTLTTSTNLTVSVPNATDTLVNLGSTQTLTAKTLTAPILSSASTLTLNQVSGNYTLDWANPAAGRAYHITDVGTGADFLMKNAGDAYTAGALFYADANKLRIGTTGSAGQPFLSGGTGAYTVGTLGSAAGGTGTTTVPAKGSILAGNAGGTQYANVAVGTDGQILSSDSASTNGVKWIAASSGGTVTSVAQSLTSLPFLSISGSPITTSGTLALAAAGTSGDTLYFSGANATSKLAIGAAGSLLNVVSSLPAWTTAMTVTSGALTLGTNTTTLGSVKMFGNTSGDCTLSVPAVAGTSTVFTLPSTNGSNTNVLQTNGSGVTSWVATNSGTVTSVASSLTGLPFITLSGSPITTSGTLAYTASAAKGDVIVGSGSNTYAKLAVGVDGTFLQADSTATNGVKWATSGGNYFGSGSDGATTISANTTVGDATNDNAFVIMNYSSLTINSGVSLTTQARKRALLVYVSGNCTINGTLKMDAKGAAAAASVIDVYKFPFVTQTFSTESTNQDPGLAATDYSTAAVGAAGGAVQSTGTITAGNAGSAGATNQTGGGGGGAGGAGGASYDGSGGSGSAGTAYAGGSGGGGGNYNAGAGTNGGNAATNGGAGGVGAVTGDGAAGGGAGNAPGVGTNIGGGSSHTDATGGGAGTLYLVVGGNLTIGAAGIVSADGSNGGGGVGTASGNTSGGGAGGGGRVVCLYAGTLSNSGTLRANGGAGGTATTGLNVAAGGAGGAGTVTGPTLINGP